MSEPVTPSIATEKCPACAQPLDGTYIACGICSRKLHPWCAVDLKCPHREAGRLPHPLHLFCLWCGTCAAIQTLAGVTEFTETHWSRCARRKP